MKIRGFEVAKGWEDKNINLPKRSTKNSAAYDVEAGEDIIIPVFKKGDKPTLIHTGLKAYCQSDEWYALINRSSNPIKRKLVLANGIGVIDADYYENETNDGEFMFAYYNLGEEDLEIKKGEIIGQVLFQKFLVVDNDNASGVRVGGFGSTD